MGDKRVHLARPRVGDEEVAALRRVIDSGILSRGGRLEAFEAGMARLAGTVGGVGVNSGTTGLQIALEALGVGPGDEVITPAFTFVGTVNAIVRTGARAVLVDVDEETLNIDPLAARSAINEKTRAILIVHLFGRPAPMRELIALAGEYGLFTVEDACEAIGARYRGRPVGGLADAGVFGFYANKPIATGEGGMIVANDAALLQRCRQLRNQGNDTVTGTRHADRPGFSARLSELHAALGNVQLEKLDDSLQRRRTVAGRYYRNLGDHPGLQLLPPADEQDTIAWFTFPLRLRGAAPDQRDRLIAALAADGIESGIYFEPVHRLPFHDRHHDGRALPVSEDAGGRSLALPLHPGLAGEEVDTVCDCLLRNL